MSWRPFLRGLARTSVRSGLSWAIVLGAGVGRLFRRGRVLPDAPRSILVIRLDLLGDLVFSMPAVEGLRRRFPDARIVMVTLPYVADLARRYDCVDEVIALDTNRVRTPRGLLSPGTWRAYLSAWRQLRSLDVDLAVSINGLTASLVALLSGARYTGGYRDDSYPFTLDGAVPGGRYQERKHEVEYGRQLARAAGATDVPDRMSAPDDPSADADVVALLRAAGVESGDRLVLMHAGSLNGNAKRWPEAQWVDFIAGTAHWEGVRLALIGAAGDAPIANAVAGASAVPVLNLVGRTTIPQLVALIRRADLLVTGDSGPLHIAVAAGTPTVSIFGPTDPAIYGPYHPTARAVVLRANLPCSPCYTAAAQANCPLGDPICMRLVTAGAVLRSAEEILGIRRDQTPVSGA